MSSNKQKLKYCGHVLTSEGILPDPAKVEAITRMPRPRSKTEVRRLLGMINYLGKFLPQLSDVSEPLRNLTKEQNQFIWSKVHQDAFNKLTQLISEPPPPCYYDLEEEVTIETDASDYGLVTVLLQPGRPVAFASRTMTETERRYSQIEKKKEIDDYEVFTIHAEELLMKEIEGTDPNIFQMQPFRK